LTAATITSPSAAVAGLQRFITSYAALRPVSPIVAPDSGLANFLDKARPILREALAAMPVIAATPMVSPQRLGAALASLQRPLRQAWEDGEFLQVWSIAGLKRNELRNAAVLAWLIDPHGSHGHGPAILRGLLLAAAQVSLWPLQGVDLSRVRVHTEERPLGSDRDRVDIAVDGPDFILFVEVKIDADEGRHQLFRYAEAAAEKARAWRKAHALVIYLSPRTPIDPPSGVAFLTWRDVARVLSKIPARGINGSLVNQFARHIRSFF
jgi:hypothetical protein